MLEDVRTAILKTLAYSDVFDYPLKKEELWRFLIVPSASPSTMSSGPNGSGQVSKGKFKDELDNVSSVVRKQSGFYCFLGRAHIIKKREKRAVISKKKTKIVEKTVRFLRSIPSIQLIGVSGALAMRNAEEKDDIDLFIIVQRNRLWLTRLFLLVFLEFLGVRRKRDDRATADKVCLNMLVDEFFLCLPKDKQDLYSAHEVVQLLPVFERNNAYARFIRANLWIKKFLPNSVRRGITRNTTRNHAELYFSVVLRFILRLSALEFFAKILQLWYMKKHQTTEVISDTMLAFHPFDYRRKILKDYNQRLRKYDILPALKGGVSPLKENVVSSSIHPRLNRGFLEASNKII